MAQVHKLVTLHIYVYSYSHTDIDCPTIEVRSFYQIQQSRCPPPLHLRMETGPVSKTLHSLVYQTMDEGQNPSNPECYKASSELLKSSGKITVSYILREVMNFSYRLWTELLKLFWPHFNHEYNFTCFCFFQASEFYFHTSIWLLLLFRSLNVFLLWALERWRRGLLGRPLNSPELSSAGLPGLKGVVDVSPGHAHTSSRSIITKNIITVLYQMLGNYNILPFSLFKWGVNMSLTLP